MRQLSLPDALFLRKGDAVYFANGRRVQVGGIKPIHDHGSDNTVGCYVRLEEAGALVSYFYLFRNE